MSPFIGHVGAGVLVGTALSQIAVLASLFFHRSWRGLTVAIVAFAVATQTAVLAVAQTIGEHVSMSAFARTAGDDPQGVDRILCEAYAEGIPRLVLSGISLVLAALVALRMARTNRTRLPFGPTLPLSALTGFLCLVMALLASRSHFTHERLLRASFDERRIGTEQNPECTPLIGAVEHAASFENARHYTTNLDERARVCVARWLSAADIDGPERRRVEGIIELDHQLRLKPRRTIVEWVSESPLLVNDAQRRDVARRLAAQASR